MKAMLCGEKPLLLATLVRFLMECDEALAMRGDDYLNPLYAHSPVSTVLYFPCSRCPAAHYVTRRHRFFQGASSFRQNGACVGKRSSAGVKVFCR